VENVLQIEQGARFKKILKRLKLTQGAISKAIGCSQTLISQICTGDRPISRIIEKKIAEKLPDINFSWVFTGEGSMFLSESRKDIGPGVEEPRAVYGTDPLDQLRRKLNEYEERINSLEQRVEALESVQ